MLTRQKAIFGGMMISKVLNSIVLLAKQFITRQRAQERAVNVSLFRSCVRNEFCMERIAAMRNRDMEKLEPGVRSRSRSRIRSRWSRGNEPGVGFGVGVDQTASTLTPERFV